MASNESVTALGFGELGLVEVGSDKRGEFGKLLLVSGREVTLSSCGETSELGVPVLPGCGEYKGDCGDIGDSGELVLLLLLVGGSAEPVILSELLPSVCMGPAHSGLCTTAQESSRLLQEALQSPLL